MSARWVKYVVAGLSLAACGSTIPKELVNARSAYNAMSSGAAASTVPDSTTKARDALARAEDSFQHNGATRETRDLALEAERAAVQAQIACAHKGRDFVAITDWDRETTTPEVRINEILNAVPGTVMFEFDKSDLLPAGKERLDQLAEALNAAKEGDKAYPIVIEGHADAVGSDEYNLKLSERRARAVKDYLTTKGYDASFVEVRALGEDSPFTTNATVEGRANNRRVEIRLEPKKSKD